jgi:hypothetical protein
MPTTFFPVRTSAVIFATAPVQVLKRVSPKRVIAQGAEKVDISLILQESLLLDRIAKIFWGRTKQQKNAFYELVYLTKLVV